MSSPHALAPPFVLVLLTACSDPDPTQEPVDSGVSTDAGNGTDAGADAGTLLNLNTQALPEAYVGRPYSVRVSHF